MNSSLGQQVTLKDISRLDPELGPMEIRREDRQRQVIIGSGLKNAPLSEVINGIKAKLKGYKLPKGYSIGFTGQAQQMQESFGIMTKALFLFF